MYIIFWEYEYMEVLLRNLQKFNHPSISYMSHDFVKMTHADFTHVWKAEKFFKKSTSMLL